MFLYKRESSFDEDEIERFCQGTLEVIKKIHDRADKKHLKKKQRKKKTTTLIESE
jgi:hypothetical protein